MSSRQIGRHAPEQLRLERHMWEASPNTARVIGSRFKAHSGKKSTKRDEALERAPYAQHETQHSLPGLFDVFIEPGNNPIARIHLIGISGNPMRFTPISRIFNGFSEPS
jgi:hypothetical protein